MIIAIDGPAGAGKSTIAKSVARSLGFLYIDTGAMYRALTLKAIERQIDIRATQSLIALAEDTDLNLINDSQGNLQVFLDGRDVSVEIRQPGVNRYVSDLAKIKDVRQILVKLQRKLGIQQDSVLDGRDIGTVVFPDADKKFYLDAAFDERVRRRYEELRSQGITVAEEDVAADLRNRDTIDSKREYAPLKKADDAVYIDTTDLSIEEVVDKVLTYVNDK